MNWTIDGKTLNSERLQQLLEPEGFVVKAADVTIENNRVKCDVSGFWILDLTSVTASDFAEQVRLIRESLEQVYPGVEFGIRWSLPNAPLYLGDA